MAVINVNLAPFINEQFVVTGYWGEPRSGHIHARNRPCNNKTSSITA